MKHLIAVGFTVLGFTLIAGPSVVSAEHTAYAFRSTDGQFLEIALPSEAPSEPTWADPVSRDLSWNGAGSTRDSDERILSLDFISSEIIAFDPFVPIHQVVSTLGLPLHWTSDLSLGPGDDLILLREDELFDVDPATGSTVLRAQLGQDYGSIEYHQGFFYASGGIHQFVRIDPVTHEETPVGPSIPFCGFPGLSSDGTNLWYLMTCHTGGSAPTSTSLGTIDPATGQRTPYINLVNNLYLETYFGLEIIEQAPSSIPALHPLGLFVLTFLVGGTGVLMARQIH